LFDRVGDLEEQKKKDVQEGKTKATRSIEVASLVSSIAQLEELIDRKSTRLNSSH
jgi:hypothetical protein